MEEKDFKEIMKISDSLLSNTTTPQTSTSMSSIISDDEHELKDAEEVLKSLAESNQRSLLIPLNEILKDMYNSEEHMTSAAATNDSVVNSIDLTDDSKDTYSYHNLDQPKLEPSFTMDASFLYEDNANQCSLFPVAPPSTPVTPFQRYQPVSSMQFLNYPNGLPYNYGYNFVQQPSFMYTQHVQSSAGSHNPLHNMTESSAFTPIKPKFFSPRLLNFENHNDNRSCQSAETFPQKVGPGRKKKLTGSVPTATQAISVSHSAPQSVQLKEIQEIFTNTQIPISITTSTSPMEVEPIIRFPLQTRATVSNSVKNDNSNWISRLANYFDTSHIEIPMPQVTPKPKRSYRRKQKLETIDSNNNSEFVLQNVEVPAPEETQMKKERKSSSTFVAIKNVEKEVDEIFRQRKRRKNVPVSKESDSDSDEIPLKLIKTHKCPNCKKMYKTPKTLGQHLKKCSPPTAVVSSTTEVFDQMDVPPPILLKEELEDADDFKFVYCSDSDNDFKKAEIPKEEEFVFTFNEESLDIKSETGSESEQQQITLKRLFSSTQNMARTPSPCSMIKTNETLYGKSPFKKRVVEEEDEDSIISVQTRSKSRKFEKIKY